MTTYTELQQEQLKAQKELLTLIEQNENGELTAQEQDDAQLKLDAYADTYGSSTGTLGTPHNNSYNSAELEGMSTTGGLSTLVVLVLGAAIVAFLAKRLRATKKAANVRLQTVSQERAKSLDALAVNTTDVEIELLKAEIEELTKKNIEKKQTLSQTQY